MEHTLASYLKHMSASVEAVWDAISWAEKSVGAHSDLNPDSVNFLLVCMEELLANVVLHAGGDDFCPQVKVGLNIEAGQIELVIEDDGPPFDPVRNAPDSPLTDLASATVSGLGLRIVRNMCSAMSYDRSGDWNRVQVAIG